MVLPAFDPVHVQRSRYDDAAAHRLHAQASLRVIEDAIYECELSASTWRTLVENAAAIRAQLDEGQP